MFEFFEGLVSFFSSIINFLVNFFSGLLQMLKLIPQSLVFITQAIGYMPPFLIVFVTAIVSLSVIMMIVNHGG